MSTGREKLLVRTLDRCQRLANDAIARRECRFAIVEIEKIARKALATHRRQTPLT